MRGIGLVVLLLAAASVAVPAQAQEIGPNMVIQVPTITEAGTIPAIQDPTELHAPWTLTYPTEAAAAAAAKGTKFTIHWSLECTGAEILLGGVPFTEVSYFPGVAQYTGTLVRPIYAAEGSPGASRLDCTLSAVAPAVAEQLTARDSVRFQPVVAFAGDIRITVEDANQTAGPQKMVRYPLVVENLGNAATHIRFEVLEAHEIGGGWAVLAPEALIVEPGTTATAIVSVATKYDNGPNSGSLAFVVRAYPSAAADESMVEPPLDIPLKTTVKGMYIPGPGPALLLLGLAAAVAFLRRE